MGMAELQSWSWCRLSETCTRCSRKWNLVRKRNDGVDIAADTNGTGKERLIIRVQERCLMLFSTHEYCPTMYGCGVRNRKS